jgi:hypothetical protein
MTSTTTGLPDRYRPLDQVGPDETTPTGVIRCWRAKDRVLNRDVAIRVHTPAGPAAHEWITRALTAGGLATPALAMVYDASEGIGGVAGEDIAPGGAAYVVNEWIEGETLAERLTRGPLPERDVRTLLRRLADGVAEAHKVGLAVGGLTPDNVVLRPNGLVGLRAVPAATGSIDGDIAALGSLLEATLTGLPADGSAPRPLTGPSDLVALAHRAGSTDPGQRLTSVAAMAALLAERPRSSASASHPHRTATDDTDGGWRRRLRERRTDGAERAAVDGPPVRLNPDTLPPVPAVHPITGQGSPLPPAALGANTVDAGGIAPAVGRHAGPAEDSEFSLPAYPAEEYDDEPFGMLATPTTDETFSGTGYEDDVPAAAPAPEDGAKRHRLVVIGLPVLALIVVIGLAWWVGSSLLSVAGSVDGGGGSAPSVSVSAGSSAPAKPAAGAPVKIVGATVFDPEGDGQPENDNQAPLSYDGNPATFWKTLDYRGSAAFGNLKKGVGLVYDLGSAQSLSGVTITSSQPGATVEVRTGSDPHGTLDSFTTVASGTINGSTALNFTKTVSSRYVLVWITGLVPSNGVFSADLAEVVVHSAK